MSPKSLIATISRPFLPNACRKNNRPILPKPLIAILAIPFIVDKKSQKSKRHQYDSVDKRQRRTKECPNQSADNSRQKRRNADGRIQKPLTGRQFLAGRQLTRQRFLNTFRHRGIQSKNNKTDY